VVESLKQLSSRVSDRIQADNGSEFISKSMDRWTYDNQVVLDLSRPGKPNDNPFIESFNGSFRDERLNQTGSCHWKMREARLTSGEWSTMSIDHIHRWQI